VVTDIDDRVNDLLTVELEHDAEETVGAGMLGTEVQEQEVRIFTTLLHPPLLRTKLQSLLFPFFFLSRELERAHLCGPRGMFLPERMALPCGRHENSKVIPNMSQTSRSYQLAEGQIFVTVGREGRSPFRATLMRKSSFRS
jgi:hypothetical protein